jgi:4a-hydroxytetrahydrobiopterin dehydratase
MVLTSKKRVPGEQGMARHDAEHAAQAAGALDGWDLRDGASRLHKHFRFVDFVAAMRFVNAMAEVAEAEGHHPDFTVHYADVDVTLWTHAVGGLTGSDFVLAARLDARPESRGVMH